MGIGFSVGARMARLLSAAALCVGMSGLAGVMSAQAADGLSAAALGKFIDPTAVADVFAGNPSARMRVIVQFREPAIPDAPADATPDQVDQIRIGAIEAAQDAILASVFGGADGLARAAASDEVGLKRMSYVPMFALSADNATLERLAAHGAVTFIQQDIPVPPLLNTGSPTSLERIGMPATYSAGASGSGWHVAVLDTGGRRSHEFLSSRIVSAACYNTNDAGTGSVSQCPGGVTASTAIDSADDCDTTLYEGCAHGTHVAGTAAGFNTNVQAGEPLHGVAKDSRLISINVFSRFPATFGSCGGTACVLSFTTDQILGLERVYALRTTLNIAAVNMSLGGGSFATACDTDSRKSIIDLLRAANIATVIAAGNSGFNASVGAPGCISSAITVASSTKADARSSFSNWGTLIDVVAPGSDINASYLNGNAEIYASLNGTSMAAPHVAGAFAAIRSLATDATVTQIESSLEINGTNITSAGVTKPRINVNTTLSTFAFKASINSHGNGQVLISTPVTFTWSAGTGVSQYWLEVGTTQGGKQILDTDMGTTRTRLVTGLPETGTVHVRLWSKIGAAWLFNDTNYTMNAVPVAATIFSPPNGASLISASATFSWNTGTNVSQYWLEVGTTPGGKDILDTDMGTTTNRTVTGLPLNGPLHVRLWSRASSGWLFRDTSYTMAQPFELAQLTAPGTFSPLTTPSVTATWSTGINVSRYWLSVGTTVGGTQIFDADMGTSRSQLVTGLPATGTVHFRIWSRVGSAWQFRDSPVTMNFTPVAAVMQTPTPGAALDTTSSFNWSAGSGIEEYWLTIGTTAGAGQVLDASMGRNLSREVSGLPANGTLFIRLWSRSGTTWLSTSTTYEMSTIRAAMTSPTPGRTVNNNSVQLSWSAGTNVTQYWLEAGTTQGGKQLLDSSMGTARSGTVLDLPNGTVHVRLWSLVTGTGWVFNDYRYTVDHAPNAVMTSPAPGATLGASATFNWSAGTGATAYWLEVGTSIGGTQIANINTGAGRTATVSGLPASGPIYVRVWTQFGTAWRYMDYMYNGGTGDAPLTEAAGTRQAALTP
jgi:subtilisin family serine protease